MASPYAEGFPLELLRSFEAAARFSSFSAAARELGVTPPAISQAVARLEQRAGCALFQRAARQVSLTEAGARLWAAVRELQPGLARLDEALATLRPRGAQGVRLSAPPTFTALWLLPRLPGFAEAHPEVPVMVDADRRLVELEAEGFELAIRYAEQPPGHFKRVPLFAQTWVAVCTPTLAAAIRRRGHLGSQRLLHESDASRWQAWFDSHPEPDAQQRAGWDGASGLFFSQGSLAVAAALRGMGVALTEPAFVQAELARGELVQPLPHQAPSSHRYHLVWSGRYPLSAGARQLKDWLLAEARAQNL